MSVSAFSAPSAIQLAQALVPTPRTGNALFQALDGRELELEPNTLPEFHAVIDYLAKKECIRWRGTGGRQVFIDCRKTGGDVLLGTNLTNVTAYMGIEYNLPGRWFSSHYRFGFLAEGLDSLNISFDTRGEPLYKTACVVGNLVSSIGQYPPELRRAMIYDSLLKVYRLEDLEKLETPKAPKKLWLSFGQSYKDAANPVYDTECLVREDPGTAPYLDLLLAPFDPRRPMPLNEILFTLICDPAGLFGVNP